MSDLVTYLLSGLALAGSFALVGSGIVVVYRVTHVLNFAQGSFVVFGAFLSQTFRQIGLPPGLSELAAVVVVGLIGFVVGAVAIGKPGTHPMTSLLITLGMSLVSAAVIIAVWGQNPVSPPGLTGTLTVLGATIEVQRLLVLVVAVAALASLSLLFSRTDVGRALTAAASNPRAARLVGIDTHVMGLLSFTIAGVLGGLAGVLIAPTTAVSVTSDLPFELSALAAAVFGGLRNPWMTFVGALVLGVTGQLVAGYANGSYQTQIALIMMLVLMIARSRSFTAEEAK